jgi:hypothetical protein
MAEAVTPAWSRGAARCCALFHRTCSRYPARAQWFGLRSSNQGFAPSRRERSERRDAGNRLEPPATEPKTREVAERVGFVSRGRRAKRVARHQRKPVEPPTTEPKAREVAERVGFEPTVGDKPTHAFQACTLSHSVISPHERNQ